MAEGKPSLPSIQVNREEFLCNIIPTNEVHIIMPHYNGKYDVIRAYISIIERTLYPFILTIIDDCSKKDDDGYKFLRGICGCKPNNVNIIFNDRNVGVTTNLNYGFKLYPTLDCVRVDADIEIQTKHWLNECVKFGKEHKNVGVIAPIGICHDYMTIQTSGQWLIISPEDNKHLEAHGTEHFTNCGEIRGKVSSEPIEVDSPLGCCVYIKREVIDAVGGVDENYFGWVEDNDFNLSARLKGYKCFILPHVSYCHHHNKTKRPSGESGIILENSHQYFIKKWGFSLFDPAPYWKDIVKKYKGTEVMWRYNDQIKDSNI